MPHRADLPRGVVVRGAVRDPGRRRRRALHLLERGGVGSGTPVPGTSSVGSQRPVRVSETPAEGVLAKSSLRFPATAKPPGTSGIQLPMSFAAFLDPHVEINGIKPVSKSCFSGTPPHDELEPTIGRECVNDVERKLGEHRH